MYSKHQECPEKRFINEFPFDELSDYYKIDGTYKTLELTGKELINHFKEVIDEKEVIDFFWSV
jgi:hypothetical protein